MKKIFSSFYLLVGDCRSRGFSTGTGNTNYQESEVPEYALPALLKTDNGRAITTFYLPIPNDRFTSMLAINQLITKSLGGYQYACWRTRLKVIWLAAGYNFWRLSF